MATPIDDEFWKEFYAHRFDDEREALLRERDEDNEESLAEEEEREYWKNVLNRELGK